MRSQFPFTFIIAGLFLLLLAACASRSEQNVSITGMTVAEEQNSKDKDKIDIQAAVVPAQAPAASVASPASPVNPSQEEPVYTLENLVIGSKTSIGVPVVEITVELPAPVPEKLAEKLAYVRQRKTSRELRLAFPDARETFRDVGGNSPLGPFRLFYSHSADYTFVLNRYDQLVTDCRGKVEELKRCQALSEVNEK